MNQREKVLNRIATGIGRYLNGLGGLPPGFKPVSLWPNGSNWHAVTTYDYPGGATVYWIHPDRSDGHGGGDTGTYITLRNVRVNPNRASHVDYGKVQPLQPPVILHSDVEWAINQGAEPADFTRTSEQTRSFETAHDVGASLTVGLAAEVEAGPVTASVEATASYNKHMASVLGGPETIESNFTVRPRSRRQVLRTIEEGRAQQENTISCELEMDVIIQHYGHYHWEFSSLAQLVQVLTGYGRRDWRFEHDLVQKHWTNPAEPWAAEPLKRPHRVSYTETVDLKVTTSGKLAIGPNEPL